MIKDRSHKNFSVHVSEYVGNMEKKKKKNLFTWVEVELVFAHWSIIHGLGWDRDTDPGQESPLWPEFTITIKITTHIWQMFLSKAM